MPFSDIVGHKRQLETLRRGLERDRLHHAYLFVGPEGVGKKTVALSLAMAIQCRERVHDFCGRCINCVRVQSGNDPDVRVVGLLTGKKEISIEQIRELERELKFRTFSGRKKIAIVDPASLMNFSAQNALLKTLEEPPRDSLLILISTSAGGLLPTLLSRCLRLSFAPLSLEEVKGFLVLKRGVKQEEAESLAAMGMGSLGRATSPDMESLMERRRVWVERIGCLTQGDYRGGVTLAEELAVVKEECLQFLEWVEGWYRDILIFRVTGSSGGICNLDMLQQIHQQSELYSLERIIFLLSQTVSTTARIQRNVNRRMALENFLMKTVTRDS
ncbi:MAG: DNA polymerase III subunit delta' [Deltaproteobacteria bacterium]|nr:DNA polymerase III subunit delta' [Deltaproteobacteria bacterium]